MAKTTIFRQILDKSFWYCTPKSVRFKPRPLPLDTPVKAISWQAAVGSKRCNLTTTFIRMTHFEWNYYQCRCRRCRCCCCCCDGRAKHCEYWCSVSRASKRSCCAVYSALLPTVSTCRFIHRLLLSSVISFVSRSIIFCCTNDISTSVYHLFMWGNCMFCCDEFVAQ